MNILALDTSMGVCSAAVLRAHGSAQTHLTIREAEMQRGHAEALMPMIEDVLREGEVEAHDLDLIAATLGPGSFTGVRIAIAAARGLALVSRAKLYGTDSLTVMARAAFSTGLLPKGMYAVAVDARRGMLYLGLYDEAGNRLDGPKLRAPGRCRVPSARGALLCRRERGRGSCGGCARARAHAHDRASSIAARRHRAGRARLRRRRAHGELAPALPASTGREASKRPGGTALMPRKILVSRATFADAALLAALHTTSFNRSHERSLENPWGEENMARFIAGPGTLCLIGLTGKHGACAHRAS